MVLSIKKKNLTGDVIDDFTVEVFDENLTVKEIIKSYVYQYISDIVHLRSFTDKAIMKDINQQYEIAYEDFENNGFLLFVNETQAKRLTDRYKITLDTEIVFLDLPKL